MKKNAPIQLTVSTSKTNNPIFKDIKLKFQSNEVMVEAKSKPIDRERVIEQLNKTNDSIFSFNKINVDLEDNLFLPSIKILNELRRKALDEVFFTAQERIFRKSPTLEEINPSENKKIKKDSRIISLLLNILNENEKYENLNKVNRIYIPLKYFANKKYTKIINTISSKFDTYIYLPTIVKSNYRNLLKNLIDKSIDNYNIKGFIVPNLSAGILIKTLKEKFKNKYEFIGNYTLNVFNHETENEYKKFGMNTLTVSPELDIETINSITKNSPVDQELIVYGRTPLMTTNYCLLGKTNKCYPDCGVRCQENKDYYLKDRMGLYFRVISDNIQTVSTIYNSKITSIDGYSFNVNSFRIDALDESVNEINSIIETILSKKRLEGKNYTNGNLNREI